MTFFDFEVSQKLFEYKDAVFKLDEFRTMYGDAKAIYHFLITCDVISAIRTFLGVKMAFFSFLVARELFEYNNAVCELDKIYKANVQKGK